MAEIMMMLGGYQFQLETAAYQNLKRVDSWGWPTQDRILNMAAAQYTGKDAATIDLEGTIYPTFKGGLGQVEAMRGEADKEEPLMLVAGTGAVLGRWTILSITETQTIFFANGVAKKRVFALKLQKFAEDQA
jgi:phage protein U